jgi:hypothetical protein
MSCSCCQADTIRTDLKDLAGGVIRYRPARVNRPRT